MPFLYAFEAYAGPMPRFVVPIFFPASSSSLSPSISCTPRAVSHIQIPICTPWTMLSVTSVLL